MSERQERDDKDRSPKGGRSEGRPRRDDSADRTPRSGSARPHRQGDGERAYRPRRDGEQSRPYRGRDGERPSRPRDGEQRPYRGRDSERPSRPRDGEQRPYRPRDGEQRPYRGRDGERPARRPQGDRAWQRDGDRPARSGDRPFRPRPDGGRDARRPSRPPRDSAERAAKAAEPLLPDEVTARDLPGGARNELKTLSKENAEAVARHLVMAARLIDDDPALAHEHAQAAVRRAGRVAVVRETAAITAYANGDYALALRELRTYRRISGKDDQIALIVDSERGVGRPERALEEGRAVDRDTLPTAARAQLAIAMSGARLDLGDPERALVELDIPELDPDRAFEWSADLFAARAAVLEELGRDAEAAEWARRAEIAAEVWDRALGVGEDEEIIVEEEILAEDDDVATAQQDEEER